MNDSDQLSRRKFVTMGASAGAGLLIAAGIYGASAIPGAVEAEASSRQQSRTAAGSGEKGEPGGAGEADGASGAAESSPPSSEDGSALSAYPPDVPLERLSAAAAIFPGDEIAQSLLVMLRPERLAGAVCDVAPGLYGADRFNPEVTLTSFATHSQGTPLKLTSDDLGILKTRRPDCILYCGFEANAQDGPVRQALSREIDAPCFEFLLDPDDWDRSVQVLSEYLGVETMTYSLAPLARAATICKQAKEAGADRQLVSVIAGGQRGQTGYGPKTALYRAQVQAGFLPLECPKEGVFELDYRVMDPFELKDPQADIAFLADPVAFEELLGMAKTTHSAWEDGVLDACGHVLPAMFSGSFWLSELPPFEQMTLGAASMAVIAYPQCGDANDTSLVYEHFAPLGGSEPNIFPPLERDEEAYARQRAFHGKTRDDIREERRQFFRERKLSQDEYWANLEPYEGPTEEEMQEILEMAEREKERLDQERKLNLQRLLDAGVISPEDIIND